MSRVIHKAWTDKNMGESFAVTMCGKGYRWDSVGSKTIRITFCSTELVVKNWKKVTCLICKKEKENLS